MRLKSALALSLLVGVSVATPALADQYDEAWVKKCVADNSDQKQTPEVLTTYCTCMNNKMSSNETQSITAWEKTHPAEQEACSKEAGWKSGN